MAEEAAIVTIKEVEERTGFKRSVIRFYEKEKLIIPVRNDKNGYRDYSEKDLEDMKKIAYLRTLGISIEDIRGIISKEASLIEVVKKQEAILEKEAERLYKAKAMCEKMLTAGDVSFEELEIEKYVADLPDYWNDNKTIFRLDSVHFLYLWGNLITWVIITSLCLMIGLCSYRNLPSQIPIQWNGAVAVSFADKAFIFIYPLACILIRVFLRPVIYVKMLRNYFYGELMGEYVSNSLCFIALSLEIFSILFVYGAAKNVVVVLFVDAAVLLGSLLIGVWKMRG